MRSYIIFSTKLSHNNHYYIIITATTNKDTLFSEFVPPQSWYGMNMEEWRYATSNSIAAQARAGRFV